MSNYNVGFVGFGFIAKVHAYGYINLPLYYPSLSGKARITHVCAGHAQSAKLGAAQIGAEKACTDYRDVTEDPDVDIVHICTPNNLHKDALLSAMRNNKHIYCDKPLTATMAEAEEIRAALPSYAGTSQMTLQNRFFPATMRAKQLIDDGFLGKVLQFRAAYLHAGSADPSAPLKWKLSSKYGGGVIADLGPHVLDLVQHLVGDFAEVAASTQIAYPMRPSLEHPNEMATVDAEDAFTLLAHMVNGAHGSIEASKIATGAEDELRIEIHGSNGAIRFNGMDAHFLEVYDCQAANEPIGGLRGWTQVATGQRYPSPANGFPSPKNSIGWMRGHMACLANFLQDVVDGKPGDPGLVEGINLQQVLDSVKRSAGERTWVTI